MPRAMDGTGSAVTETAPLRVSLGREAAVVEAYRSFRSHMPSAHARCRSTLVSG